MDNERKAWERMEEEEEPLKWFARFDQFRLMKPWKRSVNAVFEAENKKKQEETRTDTSGEGYRPGREWYGAAEQWQWSERAGAWDAYRIAERDRLIELEEAEIMKEQYALKHKRIKDLSKVAKLLREEVFDDKKRWVEDVKSVGKEPYYVDKFNKGIISEYRATLDDIAAEMGERVKKKEIEHKGLPPSVYFDFDPDQDGTEVAEGIREIDDTDSN
jgi:hypothetical protein